MLFNGNKTFSSFSLQFSISFNGDYSFLGSGPKGPKSCRTQGWISIRPFVHPCIHPPWSLSSLKFPLNNMENWQNANFPFNNMENWWKTTRMWNSYWITWQIDEKNANFPFNIMENCSKGLKYALSGHMEIHPCGLQDIGSLGPLPKK